MDELDNFVKRDGEPIYVMVVDDDYHINTRAIASGLGDTDLKDHINNLNDWD